MTEYKEFLERNGYDIHMVGSNYFIDLLEDIVEKLLDNYDVSEIKELFPCMCLENYHFYYEVSRFKYLDELDYFSKNAYRGDSDIEKGLWNEPTIDKLIRLGNRYIEERKEIEGNKQYTKNRNCKVLNVFG